MQLLLLTYASVAVELTPKPKELARKGAQKMFKMSLGAWCIIVPLLTLSSSLAFAQRPLRRYQPPAGPTITPYLNYYRADLSTLPSPYRSFVLPQQQMQRDLYELGREQQADFRRIETQIKEVKNSTAAPTGVGATFMNYSHYYPGSPAPGRRR